jgi:hypothetical protein
MSFNRLFAETQPTVSPTTGALAGASLDLTVEDLTDRIRAARQADWPAP